MDVDVDEKYLRVMKRNVFGRKEGHEGKVRVR